MHYLYVYKEYITSFIIIYVINSSGNQEEVCHAVAQKQSLLDKRAEAAVDAYLYGIYFMEKTYKKARKIVSYLSFST